MATHVAAITTRDARFPLRDGAGSDAIHRGGTYAYPVTELRADDGHTGVGIALTLGGGNELICSLIETLASPLIGYEIEALMADFGATLRTLADDSAYRWLGPHKGMVHLALASLVNACFDLWAKSRGLPLWRLLLDLDPAQVVALLDLSYLEDILDERRALEILERAAAGRSQRASILERGYPGYDTSIGWFDYSDAQVADNVRRAVDAGFDAMKLKVGSLDPERDVRRAHLVREAAGAGATLMLDCNQRWTLPQAITMCRRLADTDPLWIEEPTHPDDVLGHRTLAHEVAPLKIALGEHVPNRVLFKSYLQADAVHFVQADCTRLAGVSEFLTVSLLARVFDRPIVPHVGDMGQIHQHLVLFNHIALDHEALLLEHIPHLRDRFVHPAVVRAGTYATPQEPGSSSDLKL